MSERYIAAGPGVNDQDSCDHFTDGLPILAMQEYRVNTKYRIVYQKNSYVQPDWGIKSKDEIQKHVQGPKHQAVNKTRQEPWPERPVPLFR